MIYINKVREISDLEWKDILLSLGLYEKLKKAKSVVIKPNFAAGTYVDPQNHVVSDLALLRSCICYIWTINKEATIYIGEADSTGYGFAYLKFEHLGLPESLNLPSDVQGKVKLLDMTRDRLQHVESKQFKQYINVDKQLYLSQHLMNAGFVISLSNLKTHSVTGYTGACKNLFGCLPDFDKSINHPYIHKVIHDLVIAIQPDLNIVDAFYGMEKNGPVQGEDVDSGYRVISNDPVEADAFAAQSIGYNPLRIKYLRLLAHTKNVIIKNNDIKCIDRKYKRPTLFLRVMNRVGLLIQRCGQAVSLFGHRIHTCATPLTLCIVIARPILLRTIDYEKLKHLKRKLLG